MEYRLLVDLEAVAVLDSLPGHTRKRLLEHFARIRATPDRLSDCHEADRLGRRARTPKAFNHPAQGFARGTSATLGSRRGRINLEGG